MATFFKLSGKRLINVEHIVSVIYPDPSHGHKEHMILMSDHTVMTLHEKEAEELLQVLYVMGEE